MVISIHPCPSQPLVEPAALESFSYRWLVSMAALGVEPAAPHGDGEEAVHVPGYFIDVDPKACKPGRGGSVVDEEVLEFEFLVPASECAPPPAEQMISGGLLLPFQRPQLLDCKEKDAKAEPKGAAAAAAAAPLDAERVLSRSLSADSWSSTGTMFSSCPSRASSASSSSSCSSDAGARAPLKPQATRRRRPLVSPAAPHAAVSPGLSPLLPRLPRRETTGATKSGIGSSLSTIPHKIARLCLCLLAAACRRAVSAVSASIKQNSGSSSLKPTGSVASRDKAKKKGRKGVDGLSSAIQWCRAESDAAVENSIREAVLHCKRSYSRAERSEHVSGSN